MHTIENAIDSLAKGIDPDMAWIEKGIKELTAQAEALSKSQSVERTGIYRGFGIIMHSRELGSFFCA